MEVGEKKQREYKIRAVHDYFLSCGENKYEYLQICLSKRRCRSVFWEMTEAEKTSGPDSLKH